MAISSATLDSMFTNSVEGSMVEDVLAGLSQSPKTIHSKFFYDARGSALFDRICELEEYYLTRTELAIMRRYAAEMAEVIGPEVILIEYGSGSSLKTPLLLEALDQPSAYLPVDISREHLEASAARLADRYPELEVVPVAADYTRPVTLPPIGASSDRRAVYFPGSTIGNFPPVEAEPFLRRITRLAGPNGGLLIGVDLEKDSDILYRAYNDAEGVTAEFNLNLLQRFNRELGANFDVDAFRHQAIYNSSEHRIEMYLISQSAQKVTLGGLEIAFRAGERILTEYSYKYSLERFRSLAIAAGFEVRRVWIDDDSLFSVQWLTVAS